MATIVALYLSDDVYKNLSKLKQRERRNVKAAVEFFLDAMRVVVTRNPGLKSFLVPEHPSPLRKNHYKVVIPDDLYDFYFHWAGECGLKTSAGMRMALCLAVRIYMKFGPQDRILTKEATIELLLLHLSGSPTWVN